MWMEGALKVHVRGGYVRGGEPGVSPVTRDEARRIVDVIEAYDGEWKCDLASYADNLAIRGRGGYLLIFDGYIVLEDLESAGGARSARGVDTSRIKEVLDICSGEPVPERLIVDW